MASLFLLYRLKPGVTREAYEAWTRERDYPVMRGLRHVASFVTHRATRLLLDPLGTPSVDYVEVFEVSDVDAFMAEDFPGQAVQAILGEFMERVDNPEIIVGEPVV